jgi:SUMO ligase MMS21 Smc5/6 complex component
MPRQKRSVNGNNGVEETKLALQRLFSDLGGYLGSQMYHSYDTQDRLRRKLQVEDLRIFVRSLGEQKLVQSFYCTCTITRKRLGTRFLSRAKSATILCKRTNRHV